MLIIVIVNVFNRKKKEEREFAEAPLFLSIAMRVLREVLFQARLVN